MKKYLLLIIVLLPLTGWAQEVDFSQIPQIQTSATYTTEVIPDKITLSITLSESNTKGKIALEELENRMEMILISNNVDIESQLKLVTLSSDFRNLLLKKTDIYKTKNYELVVDNAGVAGRILRDLESQQIANVYLSNTEYSKLEELKIELKAKAILKAKKQAEKMTKALGQQLGKAIFVSDHQTNIRLPRNIGANSYEAKFKGDLDDVEFENIRVQASVTVYFRLE